MRPNPPEYFLSIASIVASRSTCERRSVGTVLVDKNLHIIATGYNGVARKEPHCAIGLCPGINAPSGESLHLCRAIHAEINALIQCKDTDNIFAAYSTASPCISCARALMNTSCEILYFIDEYPHPLAKEEWLRSGIRQWHHLPKSLWKTVK